MTLLEQMADRLAMDFCQNDSPMTKDDVLGMLAYRGTVIAQQIATVTASLMDDGFHASVTGISYPGTMDVLRTVIMSSDEGVIVLDGAIGRVAG